MILWNDCERVPKKAETKKSYEIWWIDSIENTNTEYCKIDCESKYFQKLLNTQFLRFSYHWLKFVWLIKMMFFTAFAVNVDVIWFDWLTNATRMQLIKVRK